MSARPVRDELHRRLGALLEERRAVVWYDPSLACASVFEGFVRPGLLKIDARSSVLIARRAADAAWAAVLAAQTSETALLVYVPWARAVTEAEQVQEPFECFAQMAASFGDAAADALPSVARVALPERAAEIDRLYAEGAEVTLTHLEALASRAQHPLLAAAFGTEDPVEVAARVLMDPKALREALGTAGVRAELARLLAAAFGFKAAKGEEGFRGFARWVLFSEFALDVAGKVPPQTAKVPRAEVVYERAIYALCDRLRGTDAWRDAYAELANKVEVELQLGGIADDTFPWGERDTFAAEDRAALRYVQSECLAGRLGPARHALDLRRRSLWLHDPPRAQLWQLARRCLELLEAAARWADRAVSAQRPTHEHVRAYQSPEDGLWCVDRCQRWMERAGGDCVDREVVQGLFEHTRAVYRRVVDAAQGAFFEALVRDGWPPQMARQTQMFARHVAPELDAGQRVAYFLLDALRFEMGRDLARSLEHIGRVKVEAVAGVLPATTTFGMAALMPGAEADFRCVERDGELLPAVGGKALAGVGDRSALLRERYGDRYVDARLDDLLDANDAKLRKAIGRADLIVVRSDDIDKAGEGTNLPSARRFMTSILDDVTRVAARLARAGVTRMVLVADHGHVLIHEVAAGEVVKAPMGRWLLSKRRCRLGTAEGSAEGVRVVSAAHVGVHGAAQDMALATGFRVFSDGAAYFHEGASLQECVVPAVTLAVEGASAADVGTTRVEVSYRHARFSQRVFIVKLRMTSVLHATLDVRVVAVEAGTARQVGQAADCEARDPATGVIRLRANVEEAVAVRVDDGFDGPAVEVQALDAAGVGLVLGSKKLENACLD